MWYSQMMVRSSDVVVTGEIGEVYRLDVSKLLWGSYCIFFFKQKTAYEMLRGLLGSEMCISDRGHSKFGKIVLKTTCLFDSHSCWREDQLGVTSCLLYTSDAADDIICVDLGGRRIIQKKHTHIPSPFLVTTYKHITHHLFYYRLLQ